MSKTIRATRSETPNKYKVIPNLTMRGKEIMTRLQNRTLQLDASGQYSLETEIDETRRMSKADISRKMLDNGKKINELTAKLNKK